MKILITGITGLLGSYIARRFIPHEEIYGLKRKESDLRLLGDLTHQIQWYNGDINDFESLEAALEDKDLVIHAAGLISFDPADNDSLMKINVNGTAMLVNAMLENGVKKIIHISSVSALGRSPGDTVLDENHKWATSKQHTPYAISKYLGELEVWRAAQEGLEVMVLLPSVILGKISDQRSSTEIYDHVLTENRFYPKGNINYLDVRDAAEQVYLLYQKGVWGNRFILNSECISYKEFFQKMALVFGKKAPKVKVNSRMMRLILSFLWIGKRLRLTKTLLNPQTARLAQGKVSMDNSKIKNLLKFHFRTLEETFEWAKSNETK